MSTTTSNIPMPKQRPARSSIGRPEREPKAVGNRLWKVRKVRKLSQVEISKRLDIIQATYSAYEVGSRMLSISVASRVCDEFNVTLDYLFHGDDSGLPLPLAEALAELNGKK
jgi:transcriptional regulator with XRE-family HTH domain